MKLWDCIIVGGGPAGLSAALMLGRCRREVLIYDSHTYRNRRSYAMYGFLSRDGICPSDFIDAARHDLQKYPNISFCDQQVSRVEYAQGQFDIGCDDGQTSCGKKMILATGIKDDIPPLAGIMDFLGKSVFLCPYCDGWELCDRPIAAYGQGDRGPAFACLLKKWSAQVMLCTDGPLDVAIEDQQRLHELGIPVMTTPIERLEGNGGQLERIVFKDGTNVAVCGLFFNTPIRPCTQLAEQLGCRLNVRGEVETDTTGLSSVDGVYIAGDASPDIKLAIVAAAEGTKAGYFVNKELLREEGFLAQGDHH